MPDRGMGRKVKVETNVHLSPVIFLAIQIVTISQSVTPVFLKQPKANVNRLKKSSGIEYDFY
jgi:hypothetical protein